MVTCVTQVCQTLGILLKLALAEKLPPPDTIKVLRCVGAVLRKHVTLAPDKCALFFQVRYAPGHKVEQHSCTRRTESKAVSAKSGPSFTPMLCVCILRFQDLLACLQNQNTHVLVRCHVLDIFRSICADPMLIYRYVIGACSSLRVIRAQLQDPQSGLSTVEACACCAHCKVDRHG